MKKSNLTALRPSSFSMAHQRWSRRSLVGLLAVAALLCSFLAPAARAADAEPRLIVLIDGSASMSGEKFDKAVTMAGKEIGLNLSGGVSVQAFVFHQTLFGHGDVGRTVSGDTTAVDTARSRLISNVNLFKPTRNHPPRALAQSIQGEVRASLQDPSKTNKLRGAGAGSRIVIYTDAVVSNAEKASVRESLSRDWRADPGEIDVRVRNVGIEIPETAVLMTVVGQPLRQLRPKDLLPESAAVALQVSPKFKDLVDSNEKFAGQIKQAVSVVVRKKSPAAPDLVVSSAQLDRPIELDRTLPSIPAERLNLALRGSFQSTEGTFEYDVYPTYTFRAGGSGIPNADREQQIAGPPVRVIVTSKPNALLEIPAANASIEIAAGQRKTVNIQVWGEFDAVGIEGQVQATLPKGVTVVMADKELTDPEFTAAAAKQTAPSQPNVRISPLRDAANKVNLFCNIKIDSTVQAGKLALLFRALPGASENRTIEVRVTQPRITVKLEGSGQTVQLIDRGPQADAWQRLAARNLVVTGNDVPPSAAVSIKVEGDDSIEIGLGEDKKPVLDSVKVSDAKPISLWGRWKKGAAAANKLPSLRVQISDPATKAEFLPADGKLSLAEVIDLGTPSFTVRPSDQDAATGGRTLKRSLKLLAGDSIQTDLPFEWNTAAVGRKIKVTGDGLEKGLKLSVGNDEIQGQFELDSTRSKTVHVELPGGAKAASNVYHLTFEMVADTGVATKPAAGASGESEPFIFELEVAVTPGLFLLKVDPIETSAAKPVLLFPNEATTAVAIVTARTNGFRGPLKASFDPLLTSGVTLQAGFDPNVQSATQEIGPDTKTLQVFVRLVPGQKPLTAPVKATLRLTPDTAQHQLKVGPRDGEGQTAVAEHVLEFFIQESNWSIVAAYPDGDASVEAKSLPSQGDGWELSSGTPLTFKTRELPEGGGKPAGFKVKTPNDILVPESIGKTKIRLKSTGVGNSIKTLQFDLGDKVVDEIELKAIPEIKGLVVTAKSDLGLQLLDVTVLQEEVVFVSADGQSRSNPIAVKMYLPPRLSGVIIVVAIVGAGVLILVVISLLSLRGRTPRKVAVGPAGGKRAKIGGGNGRTGSLSSGSGPASASPLTSSEPPRQERPAATRTPSREPAAAPPPPPPPPGPPRRRIGSGGNG